MDEKIKDILSRANCYEMAEDKGKIWFSWLKANGLCQLDTASHQVKILTRYVGEPIDGFSLYSTIKKVGTMLVLGSASAAPKIVLYELEKGRTEYIDILPVKSLFRDGNEKIKYTGRCDFWRSVSYGNCVYLLGYEYPGIVKINVVTKEVFYLTEWVERIERRIKMTYVGSGYLADCVIIENFAWILCECATVILRLDMKTDEIVLMDIKAYSERFCGMCFDGENFWVGGYDNKVFKYDRKFFLIEQIEIIFEEQRCDAPLFWAPIDIGDKIILFPSAGKHVYEIDKKTNEVSRNDYIENYLKKQDMNLLWNKVLCPMKSGSIIRFITGADSFWNEYDYVKHSLVRYEVKTKLNEMLILKKSEGIKETIFEDDYNWDLGYDMTLSRFLQHLSYLSKKDENSAVQISGVGKKILQRMINE